MIEKVFIADQDPAPHGRSGGTAAEDRDGLGRAGAAVHSERGCQHAEEGAAGHQRAGETHPEEVAVSQSLADPHILVIPYGHA